MDLSLVLEQTVNGLQLGVMLFLTAAGLTLVFGIMNFVNLAHGSLYMLGAFFGASILALTGSFAAALLAAIVGAGAMGLLLEVTVVRQLLRRDHLAQVLGTFGLLIFFNEAVRILWGNAPLYIDISGPLAGSVALFPGGAYPVYRLVIGALGLAVGLGLFLLIGRTRLGSLIRAGASNRIMLGALGIDVRRLFAFVFVLGSALAGLAGAMMGPILAVQVGMGEPVLILAFVVIVIGGLGSIRGAFFGAMLIGLVDTFGRFLLPRWTGYTVGPALASIAIYVLMAGMLFFRPTGLFPTPVAAGDAGAPAPLPPAPAPSRRSILILGATLLLVAALPLLGEPFYVRVATRALIYGLAALGLDIAFGYGGLLSFGHAAFLGIGAYTAGILAANGVTSGFVVWPAAIFFGAAAAAIIGLFSLRSAGIFFIMITLAFSQMLYYVAVGLEAYGGDNGMPLADSTQFAGHLDLGASRTLFYVVLALVVAALLAARRFVASGFGVALRGIRDNERRMASIGYPVLGYRLAAFTLSGAVTGLAGALLVNLDSYVGPSTLHWFVSGKLMIMVILGGAASLLGPVVGAVLYVLLEEILSGLTQHWMAIFGPLLVLVVLGTRGGLVHSALWRRVLHGR